MKSITVPVPGRTYDVHVGSGLLGSFLDLLPGLYERAFIIEDAGQPLENAGTLVQSFDGRIEVLRGFVAGGERTKSWEEAGRFLEEVAMFGLKRNDLIIGMGGGATMDLAGFVASTYMRSVDLALIPTTLLAQVDAAIGGKNGVNLPEGKNLAGTFHQPVMALCDVDLLQSLPPWELASGMAEVVKYGLCFDERLLHTGPFEQIVARSVQIKAGIVARDERDAGERMFLNYGHTLGHALEAAAGFGGMTHGEAISVGMMFAAHLARERGMLSDEGVEVHREALERNGLPVSAQADVKKVLPFLAADKKYDARPRWILLNGLQRPVTVDDVSDKEVLAAARKVLK